MVCHLLSAAVTDFELTLDWWSTHCATWFQVSAEPRIMDLDSGLDKDDYMNGLNDLFDTNQLIQAQMGVNTEELRLFRRLHVLLLGFGQPVQGSHVVCVYCYLVSMIRG